MNAALDIPGFLDRRPIVWTFTMLHTYSSICPHQAAHRFVYKTIPFVSTPAMEFGTQAHTALEHRVGANKPLPDQFRHWEKFAEPFDGRNAKTELKLAVNAKGQATGYLANDVWGRGKADVVLAHETTAYLADWKTGNSKYEDPFELRVQALLLNVKFPQLTKIKASYVWLKEDRVGDVYDVSDTLSTWNEVSALVEAIEDDRKQGRFEKRKGPLCKWCPVFSCENNQNPDKP